MSMNVGRCWYQRRRRVYAIFPGGKNDKLYAIKKKNHRPDHKKKKKKREKMRTTITAIMMMN